jgi:hypothetical protein
MTALLSVVITFLVGVVGQSPFAAGGSGSQMVGPDLSKWEFCAGSTLARKWRGTPEYCGILLSSTVSEI